MEINLLPEIPKTRRYQWLIVSIVAFTVFGLSSFVGLHIWQKTAALDSKIAVLEQLKQDRQAKMNLLNEKKQGKEIFTVYLDNYRKLEKTHANYVPFMNQLSERLPVEGYLALVNWTSDGSIQLTGDFPSIELIGKYVQLLEELTWIEDMNVSYIQQKEIGIEGSDELIYSYQFMLEIRVDLQSFFDVGVDKE